MLGTAAGVWARDSGLPTHEDDGDGEALLARLLDVGQAVRQPHLVLQRALRHTQHHAKPTCHTMPARKRHTSKYGEESTKSYVGQDGEINPLGLVSGLASSHLAGALDGGAIGLRVREGHAQLHHVRATRLQRQQQRHRVLAVRIPGRHEGHLTTVKAGMKGCRGRGQVHQEIRGARQRAGRVCSSGADIRPTSAAVFLDLAALKAFDRRALPLPE
jgi:hypothetical protein